MHLNYYILHNIGHKADVLTYTFIINHGEQNGTMTFKSKDQGQGTNAVVIVRFDSTIHYSDLTDYYSNHGYDFI